jgi:hypothetical protein
MPLPLPSRFCRSIPPPLPGRRFSVRRALFYGDSVSTNRLGNGSELKTKTERQRNAQKLNKRMAWRA